MGPTRAGTPQLYNLAVLASLQLTSALGPATPSLGGGSQTAPLGSPVPSGGCESSGGTPLVFNLAAKAELARAAAAAGAVPEDRAAAPTFAHMGALPPGTTARSVDDGTPQNRLSTVAEENLKMERRKEEAAAVERKEELEALRGFGGPLPPEAVSLLALGTAEAEAQGLASVRPA